MSETHHHRRQSPQFSGCNAFLTHPSMDSLGLSHLMEPANTTGRLINASSYEDLIHGWNNLIEDHSVSDRAENPAGVENILVNNHSHWISELANAKTGNSDRTAHDFFQSSESNFDGSGYGLGVCNGRDTGSTHGNLTAPSVVSIGEDALAFSCRDNIGAGSDESYLVSQDVFSQLAEIDSSQPMALGDPLYYPDLYAGALERGSHNGTWDVNAFSNTDSRDSALQIEATSTDLQPERSRLFNSIQYDSSSISSNEGTITPGIANLPSKVRSSRRRTVHLSAKKQNDGHRRIEGGEGIFRPQLGADESNARADSIRRQRKSSMGNGNLKRGLDESSAVGQTEGWNGRRYLCSGGSGPSANMNRSFSSSLSKFTLPDENGKRKIRHDIMSIAESLPSLPGLYFDKKQKGFRVRYQNVYVGWVALSRFPSIEEAYCSARDIWENAKAHAEKFQTPHAAVMASLPLQKEAQASGKNRGGRPRTVTQLPPTAAEWLASSFPAQGAANAWATKYHQQLLATDSLTMGERDNVTAWKSVATELVMRAANGTLDLDALQVAGITENDLLETLQAEAQWTPPPGYAHASAMLTPASTKASETSPPLSEQLYQTRSMETTRDVGVGRCFNSSLMSDIAALGGAISYSKPVVENGSCDGGLLATEEAALATWAAGSGLAGDNFCSLSGSLTACNNDPGISVWDVGCDQQGIEAGRV